MGTTALFLAVFVACAVEATEALTIVLAVGTTRGWRWTMPGVGAGLAALAVIIGVLGPALRLIPLNVLRLVVGGLLLVFGLQWVRKAILRAAGLQASHDEAAIYERQIVAARGAAAGPAVGFDGYAFTIAFKGVLLEGLEVAFIVLTFGTNQGRIGLAVIAAAAAAVVIVGVGVGVRAPLARLPENTLKYAVGLLLTSFGTFWGAEGAGAHWPGGDLALLAVLAAVTAVALLTTATLRHRQRSVAAAHPARAAREAVS